MHGSALKTYVFMERVATAKQEELLAGLVEAFFTALSSQEATQVAEALETPMGRKLISMSIDM